MPSGKRARQQRQAAAATAPPPVRSKGAGGARARQASPRALAIGGGVVLLVILAIVLGVVLSKSGSGGGGSNMPTASDLHGLPATGSQNWPGALQGAQEANDLFKGIPQKGLVLGDPKAPVTMEMFIDVQCPVCDDYEVNHLSGVVQNYIKNGKVQLHLRPWAFLGGQGSQSFSGRLGLIAASLQNKGFQYAKVLYDNQGQEESGWLNGQEMADIAASTTGLNLQQWQSDVNSSGVKSIASDVDKAATKQKVTGTPTIFVGCTGGKLKAAMPAGSYEPQAVEPALNAAVAVCSK